MKNENKSIIEIFEPAMCCNTGLCGVSVNPELLRISTVLNTLNKNGIVVKRFNLNSSPMEFVNNKVVNDFINNTGVEKLPVILLNGEIIISERYPTNEEFSNILGLPKGLLSDSSKLNNCNCKGGYC